MTAETYTITCTVEAAADLGDVAKEAHAALWRMSNLISISSVKVSKGRPENLKD